MKTLTELYEGHKIGNTAYHKARKNAIKEIDKRAKTGMEYIASTIWKEIKDNAIYSLIFKNQKGVEKHFGTTYPDAIQSKQFETFEPIITFKDAMKILDQGVKLSDTSDIDHMLQMDIDDLLDQGYEISDFNNYNV